MSKRKDRKRKAREASNYHLTMIAADIEMLDRILKLEDAERSDYWRNWTEGFREGMAIALDFMEGRIRDVAIREIFDGHPVRVRYYGGAEKGITDPSLRVPDVPQ